MPQMPQLRCFIIKLICQCVSPSSLVAEYADADQPDLTSIIQNYILDNWEVQDNPEHLKTIRDRLVREPDSDRLLSCLGLYSQPKWDVNRQKMESFNFPKLN
jgi:hypothetical protein